MVESEICPPRTIWYVFSTILKNVWNRCVLHQTNTYYYGGEWSIGVYNTYYSPLAERYWTKYCHVQYGLLTFLYYIDDLRYFKHTLLFIIGVTALIDSNLKMAQYVMSKAIGQSQTLHIGGIEDRHFVSKHCTHDRATYLIANISSNILMGPL